jgi:two-component system nitrogen regulation sensor histidine kinase GlnL|tara:strand:- start:5821 stop:6864 length:1044 start_codon:yes stop_codon:yes gene_type:complete
MNVENILDNIATSVIITNKYMEIVHVNASGESFLRNSKEKLLNKKINDIFAKKNNLIINQIYDAIALGQSSISRDMDISLKSKIKHIVDCNVQAIYIDKEKHVLLEILQNQRHKSIEKNARFNDRNNATQMITRSIAHEIKNPLGGIRGAAQLLDSELKKNQKEYTEIIINEVDRLKNYIDRMLGPSELPELNATNIHFLIERVLKLLKTDQDKETTFVRDYDPSIPDVKIDNDMIIQALLNILKNAQEATVEGGTVLIKTRVERNYTINSIRYNLVAMIDIIDDGIGISPDIKSKLFLPLVTNKPKGSGLGLSISQKLVSLNNGIIVYEDDDARTIFKIILPIENY